MENNIKSLGIVYHYPCFDGAYAAINTYLYYKYFSRTKYNVSFYPFLNTWNQHDKLFHNSEHNKIIFLDVSISVDDINVINNNNNISLIIIDHHESNINEYYNNISPYLHNVNIKTVFDKNNAHSACGLSLQYFKAKALKRFDIQQVNDVYNELLCKVNNYVEDNDTGNCVLTNTEEFRSGLGCCYNPIEAVTDFSCKSYEDKINNLCNVNVRFTIQKGEMSLKKYRKKCKNEITNRMIYLIQLNDKWKFLVCKTQNKQYRNYGCVILGKISMRKGYLPIGGFIYKIGQDDYKLSMRTANKGMIDTSEIAKQFGGGGHKDASSFILSGSDIKKYLVKEISITNEMKSINC